MKMLLVAVNAKYIHSNLAVRSIRAYMEAHTPFRAEVMEFTINQDTGLILREIYEQAPDVVGFSCYIWNIEFIKEIASALKKVLPQTTIIWGGPEVSYCSEQYLGRYTDYIVCGDGERAFAKLIAALSSKKEMPQIIQGGGVPLDDIPFVYKDMEETAHRIIYYESSRGCPFRCQYCLSSLEKDLRFLSMERVYADLAFFLSKKVPQVKLIDRTFNCDRERANAIWQYLIEHDNGVTNFHFEIAGELLDDAAIALLSKARPGLFQFEIGVQTVNPQTLREIRRPASLEKLFGAVGKLRANGNIHLHLDLIAGLPYEDMDSFIHSFNEVYSLRPHQFQLGFLKVLKGAGIWERQAEYGLLCSERPPYEVLETKWLSFGEVLRLKLVEDMVERYYNSGRYQKSCAYLSGLFDTPFAFYEALGRYYKEQGLHLVAVSEADSYTVLYDFFKQLGRGEEEMFRAFAKYDLYTHKLPKKVPAWMQDKQPGERERVRIFYENLIQNPDRFPVGIDLRSLVRTTAVVCFPADPVSGELRPTARFFPYTERDAAGRAKSVDVTGEIFG